MTYEELMALKQEDLTSELVQELVQESAIVHYAMTRHWQDGWTLEQSLIYALVWLASANSLIVQKLDTIPSSVTFTAENGRALAQEIGKYIDDIP